MRVKNLGRRVCSGYNVGERNVWIVIARLLYCFDVEAIPVSIVPFAPEELMLIIYRDKNRIPSELIGWELRELLSQSLSRFAVRSMRH